MRAGPAIAAAPGERFGDSYILYYLGIEGLKIKV